MKGEKLLFPLQIFFFALIVTSTDAGCTTNEKRPENKAACDGQAFGTLVPYPGNCSLYLVCDCVYPTVQPCGAGLWFNNKYKTCDFPRNTVCADDATNSPVPTITTEVTTSSTATACQNTPWGVSSLLCRYYDEGALFPYVHNCTAYVECLDGCPALQYCPPDKQFNPFLNICDTPDAVKCVEEPMWSTPTGIPTTTTPNGPTETLPPGEASVVCENYPSHMLLPYADDCSMYIECLEGLGHLRTCPLQRLFNPDLGICDFPENVLCFEATITTPMLNTTTTDITTQTEPSKTTPTTTESPPGERCTGKPAGTTFSYPSDCHYYWFCTGAAGTGTRLPCPENNFYNPYTGNCGPDVPSDACRTPVTTTTVAPQSPEGLCNNEPAGKTFPTYDNCVQYVLCMGYGDALVLHCPRNNYYNARTGNCGPDVSPTACLMGEATAVLDVRVAAEAEAKAPITMATEWPTYIDGICGTFNSGQLVSYPDQCHLYIQCTYPVPVAYQCNSNDYFDPVSQKCMPQGETNCTPSGSTTNQGSSPTTVPTTRDTTSASSSTSTTYVPPVDGICAGQPLNSYLPYPNNCSKFIMCEKPLPVAYNCEDGLEFSAELQACTIPADANCGFTASPPATTETLPPATSAPTTNTPSTNAPTINTPTTNTPTTNTPTTNTPTSNTPTTNTPTTNTPTTNTPTTNTPTTNTPTTNTPTNNTPTTNTPTTNTPTTNTPTDLPNTCAYEPDGTNLPYLNDCSLYIICMNHKEVIVKCMPGTYFDPHISRCSQEASPTTCREGPTTSSTISTTTITNTPTTKTPTTNTPTTNAPTTNTPTTNTPTTNTPTTNTPTTNTPSTNAPTTYPPTTNTPTDLPNACAYEPDGINLPYLNDCSLYIICMNHKEVIVKCMPGTYFDPHISRCSQEASPTTCREGPTMSTTISTTSSTTTPSTTTNTPSPESSGNICCDKPHGSRLPYPGSCTNYVICDYPVPIVAQCPKGTIFDTNRMDCAYSPTAPCQSGSDDPPTTATPIQDVTAHVDVAGPACIGVATGTSLQYPGDCTRYNFCFGGEGIVLTCDDNWYFDPLLHLCVPRDRYSCPW